MQSLWFLPILETQETSLRILSLYDCTGLVATGLPAAGREAKAYLPNLNRNRAHAAHFVWDAPLTPSQSRKLEARSQKLESVSHPRYLGLDVGNRRIGVAVSDELGLTAQPVLTLERRHNQREDLRSLGRLARRFAVVGIVVGNPVHLSGDLSPQAVKTQAFAAALGELTGLPIHLWDERLTTREAHQILYEAGHARQQHRKVVDQVAATLILRSFMEKQGTGDREQRSGNSPL
jgi:putative Holliday junction resolvase